ncbi:zinc finger and BTB domain-containing protein 40 isoform 2-T2 [Pelodytes ibericus]
MELPNYSRQLLIQLHTLCKEQQFWDCTIFIGTLQFQAHKLVLAAASLLFKSLLESTDTISIDASVVTPEEFSLLLEMMYSGKLPPGKHNLTKIISVADSLQMFDVAVSCKNLLTEIMSHTTQAQKLKDIPVVPKPAPKAEILPKLVVKSPRNELQIQPAVSEKITPIVPPSSTGPLFSPPPDEAHANKGADLTETDRIVPDPPGDTFQSCSEDLREAVSGNVVESSTPAKVDSPAQVNAVPPLEGLDKVSSIQDTETLSCASSTLQDDSHEQSKKLPVVQKDTDSGRKSEEPRVTSAPSSSAEADRFPKLEEDLAPAAKKRRLTDPEKEKVSGELDFLTRYESIFSEALSDPLSVLENLKKCRHVREDERQAVVECCQGVGGFTFTKLLEKVKDGQSIMADTVLALLKLCRHKNPRVNEAFRERDPEGNEHQMKTPIYEDKLKSLFDLLVEHREELIQCITELSPIIECLDTAEEGFLTNIEKQVIIDCCEGGSHKEAMDRLLRKASDTKTLSPDSLVKLLLAVREAFPDLHTLLEMLEPHSIKSPSVKLSTVDYGLELLRQYQENFCEVVSTSEMVLSGISSATNLTAYETEVMEQIVKTDPRVQIFSSLMASVLEDNTLTVMAAWQLLFAMRETNTSLKLLIEEIRKEPGAEAFFQTVCNRETKSTEIVLHFSDLIVQALGQNDTARSIPPDDEALTDLVKELLSVPAQSQDSEMSSKTLLRSAFREAVPVMKFCNVLFSLRESAPDLQPIIKQLEQLGLLLEKRSNPQTVSKWSVNSDCQLVVVEEVGERNEDDAKGDEQEDADSKKEESESSQEKESVPSSKKNFVCRSCDKIFLFRCRLEVHTKRCRMSKRNPLQCRDCNEVLASRQELDQHRKAAHGYIISARSYKGKKRLLVVCDICGKEFAHPSGLQYHKRTEHFEEKPFSCKECGAKFAANSTLKNHQRLHTGEKPFVCKHCHMTFTQAAALSYHTKKKHSEGKMYVCQYCDAVFAQSIELTRHVRTHTGDKPYVCRECGKGFSQANGLSIHLRTFHNIEDPYDCQKCRMSFPTLEEHRKHIQVVHSKEFHPCPTCEKIFSSPSLLERHVVSHVGGKPYNCEVCDKAYQQLSGLWYHNRTHHPDLFAAQNHRSSKFSVQCNACEQFFSNPSILQKHTKLEHTVGKLYGCDKCDQSYPTPAALQVHVKCKHSGSQPFQCLYCSDCFQFPGALQHHVATHHFNETESTFGCELCGELFINQSQLEQHYESDHLTEAPAADGQVVQVIQAEDQISGTEQVITLEESHLAGSQVIVALPDSQSNSSATELVAVSMEDLLDGTVTLICGDSITGVTQRTPS